ncbi:MAG: hypothetical protein QOI38_561 [Sphingomonadales bacterium]|jgi:hypothetical protein|nr:hypothetical protein [Sphingomonadales bacterium]
MATDFPALDQPLPDGGIRTVNFFNGRLLTGSDMGREQAARREADARIGLALGDGVAEGLFVTYAGRIAPNNRPAVTVARGIAVNREGRTLRLPEEVTIAISRSAPAGPEAVPCLFEDCTEASAGGYVAGQGLYLLTIAPAFVSEGRAKTNGFDDQGVRCNTDATVEAVQFRTIPVDPRHLDGASFATTVFRNRVAYRAFGEGVTRAWAADLLGSDPRGDDLLEALGSLLHADEVPLALLAFTGSFDHLFTDNWSVRRPVCLRDAPAVVANLAEPRRVGVGRAMFRQFQEHISTIAAANGKLPSVTARSHFKWLPPAGILPWLTDAEAHAFFAGMTVRGPLHIDAASAEPLIRESFDMPAIDTASAEAVWLYRIAQNRMESPQPAQVMIFASGHLPYRGDARFNLNYWNYANYALIP